ncbi:MAG: hypothetical protein KC561_14630, partial [Myxococcales bacterium]|nr:hypothetical protein [Myxococcales bacterium]
MSEFIFPLAAVVCTYLLVVPAFTVLSALVLRAKRRRALTWTTFGSPSTFAWLVIPALLPSLWLISSVLHQSEPAERAGACLIEHGSSSCLDTLFLLATLLVGSFCAVTLRLWRDRPRLDFQAIDKGDPLNQRV